MPLKKLLQDFVNDVDGALGAMFLDQEGEAVVVTDSSLPAYDLQVIGAYSGIFLGAAQRLAGDLSLGKTDRIKLQCRESNLFIARLNDGYYLVLVLSNDANEGLAWRRMLEARERLNQEI